MLTRRTLLLTLPFAAVLAGCADSAAVPDPADAAAALTTADGSQDTSADPGLAVEDFAQVVAEAGTVVIDVRTPQEYAEGHLEGALNLDVSAPGFSQELEGLDPDASYAVYCRTGVRSAAALQIMRDHGFTSLVHLAGGVTAWTKAGKPVAS
ncbi:rhodanese-like domain-containing protein [Ornithinimicrobium cerasi]|uniref:rhodanese-like domain-containing protein n=1 Tax=Ornithinimicrobium cerasi TaxID=2248773 RepID=UPI000EFEC37E|nr:rhodanese-like domain-containing protein [Ornithinimicrobium cerasi]